MTFTVLLTSASGPLVPQAIRYLKESERHQISVVATDMAPSGAAGHFADAFLKVPAGDAPEYVAAIVDITRTHKVDLVLPWSDEEALALSEAKDRVEAEGAVLACAPAEMLRIMSDKAKSYALLSELGLPVARWAMATSGPEIEAAVRKIVSETGEAAVKPANSRGGRDIFVIRTDVRGAMPVNHGRELHLDLETFMDAHLARAAELAPVIVMERLLTPAYDIDVLASAGTALRIVPRRRHNPGGVPFEGNDIVMDSRLIELGRRTAEAVGLTWLYDFDVMTDRHGEPAIIELNPRPSGSMPSAIAAGVPILDDLVSLAKGEPLPDLPPIPPRSVVPYKALSVGDPVPDPSRTGAGPA